MDEEDAVRIEELYQKAIYAASSFGSGIDSILKEEVTLHDPDYRAMIVKVDGNYTVRKSLKGWFGKSYDLQRGYGAYTVQGEDDEVALGPVHHVVFVIHGIGEAMWSREDISITSLVDQTTNMRLAINKKQIEEWKQQCESAKKQKYVIMLYCVVSRFL